MSRINADTAVKLSELVDELDIENGLILDTNYQNKKIVTNFKNFLNDKSNLISVLQIQSFCLSTNDYQSLNSLYTNLKTLIEFSNKLPDIHSLIKPLIIELLSLSNIKYLIKSLNNETPTISIPALCLLNQIVLFNNGTFVELLIENFDFSVKSISDLLFPTKSMVKLSKTGKSSITIRHHMIEFWINLCSLASPLTRNDLLIHTNFKKINHNLFKFMVEFDNNETISKIIDFINSKILNESNFRKMTKCKILNDFVLSKLLEIYKRDDENIKNKIHDLMLTIATDEDKGILFHDYRNWFDNVPINCIPSSSNFNTAGVPIVIGDKNNKFTINNKLIYNVLTLFNPWSDSHHLKLLIEILDKVPELSRPYTNYLYFINGSHLPKLSSFYIGQTLLFTKLIQLPIPEEFINMIKKMIELNDDNENITLKIPHLSCKTLIENIVPLSLNKSSLIKGLSSDIQLIKHLTTQVIISVIQKFDKVNKLLKFNENSKFLSLRNEIEDYLIKNILPDSSVFIGIINDYFKEDNLKVNNNKLLLLNYLKIVELYNDVLNINIPLQLGSFNKIVNIDIENNNNISNDNELSNIDLLLFNSYISIISKSSEKWWNISKTSKNSMFTIISKLPYNLQYFDKDNNNKKIVNTSLILNCCEILSNFLDSTLIFNDFKLKNSNILNSQSLAIILSLLDIFNNYNENSNKTDIINAISKILDESISRCIRTPYKYIDMIKSIDNNVGLSPFYVAVCEQSKFIENKELEKIVIEWIRKLSIYLYLLGESTDDMTLIFKDFYTKDLNIDLITLNKDINNEILKSDVYFSELIFMPNDKLKSKINHMIPKTDYEIVAIVKKIELIVYSGAKFDKYEELLFDLISLYNNYLNQKYSNYTFGEISIDNMSLLDEKYWIKIFVTKDDNDENIILKKIFVMNLLNEIFKEFKNNFIFNSFKSSLRDETVKLMALENVDAKVALTISKFLWILTDEQVYEFINGNHYKKYNDTLFKIAKARDIQFQSCDVIKYLDNGYQKNGKVDLQFDELCTKTKFNNEEIKKLLDHIKSFEVSKSGIYFKILNNVISNKEFNEIILADLNSKIDEIVEDAEGFKLLQKLSVDSLPLQDKLFNFSIKQIENMICDNKINNSILSYLKSIALFNSKKLSNSIEEMIYKLINIEEVKNNSELIFSNEITNLIFKLSSDTVKIWLNRAILYITKMFAEFQDLPLQFFDFLKCLEAVVPDSIWKYVSKNMINSQLEVILNKSLWIQNTDILKYVTWVVKTGSKNVIEYVKLINILINNESNLLNANNFDTEKMEIKYYTSIILSLFYQLNLKETCKNFENNLRIIRFYKGTINAFDSVLKDLMIKIESETDESWVQFVSNWDLINEEGNNDLIINTPGVSNSLTVILNRPTIERTIRLFEPTVESIKFPELQNKVTTHNEDISKIRKFYKYKDMEMGELNHVVIYDIEFLLLLIVNNEELFKIEEDRVKVNIQGLIDSNLLQLVICGLAHDSKDIYGISKRIISAVLLTIEEDIKKIELKKNNGKKSVDSENQNSDDNIGTFKERTLFKVYLGSLLYTIEIKRQEGSDKTPKLFIMMLSYLVPILSNPGHFLYEKVYRYILNGSKYRDYEIPLYKSMMNNFIKDEHTGSSSHDHNEEDDYYRQLQWMLNTLGKCIKSSEDLKILRRNDVIEQLLNLSNSPFLNVGMEDNIINIFEQIIRVENGADLLIRSFALMSFIDTKNNIIDRLRKGRVWSKYEKLAVKSVVGSECNGKDQRSRDWSCGDSEQIIKRICL